MLERSPGGTLVLTTDLMVEGVHFLREHPPAWVGQKLLAASLSDLSAMGARPGGFVLTAALTPEVHGAWWEWFSAGLGRYAERTGASLTGGDVVRTHGGLGLGITAWGRTAGLDVLTRDGGEPGDRLLIHGPVGRSEAGLRLWRDRAGGAGWGEHEPESVDPALRHHLCPEPDLEAGPWALANGASAGMDLSDGLLVDAPRLSHASGVKLQVDLAGLQPDPFCAGLSAEERAAGGEDYALMVLVPPHHSPRFLNRGFMDVGVAQASLEPGDDPVSWSLGTRVFHPTARPFRHFGEE